MVRRTEQRKTAPSKAPQRAICKIMTTYSRVFACLRGFVTGALTPHSLAQRDLVLALQGSQLLLRLDELLAHVQDDLDRRQIDPQIVDEPLDEADALHVGVAEVTDVAGAAPWRDQ